MKPMNERRSENWGPFQRALRLLPTSRRAWRIGGKLLGSLLMVSVVCASLLYAAKGNPRSARAALACPKQVSAESAMSRHPSANGDPPNFEKIVEGKYIEDRESYRFVYTVGPALQASVSEVLRGHRPPFSAFVAIEPKTGKVLALADYSRDCPEFAGLWQRATYPAASVFKLVTAAGALEKGLLSYDSPLSFRGNLYRLGPQKLARSSKRDRRTNFDEALGKSNNVVFGRVASTLLGSQALRQCSEAFGFNHSIQFDFPLDMSKAFIPERPYDLARCGAGFGEVTLNPLHAAMIAASIANGGIMMRPYLIEEIIDESGEKVYAAKPEVLAQPISAKTALGLSRMMRRTVDDGTASKIFRRYGKDLLKKVSICGKTGSLSGDNPPGIYDWFVGFAPGEDPQIAFSAMVINHDRWRIKAAFVAQEALKTFFRQPSN
ncbi:MAG: penicillin-binding protein [Deltaproteobacteria bacterium]|nr:penicillin-binding protein [Deltaproteobacteria bacterium]